MLLCAGWPTTDASAQTAATTPPARVVVTSDSPIVAGERTTVRFRVTALRPVAAGDTVEVRFPLCAPFNRARWTPPTLPAQNAPGRVEADAAVDVRVAPYPLRSLCRGFQVSRPDRYPPVIHAILRRDLAAGETVEIAYGATGPEGNGQALAQSFPERDAPFGVWWRPATGDPVAVYGPGAESGDAPFRVGRRPAARLHVSGAAQGPPDETLTVRLAALDALGFEAEEFVAGTIVYAIHESGERVAPTASRPTEDRCVRLLDFELERPGVWWVEARHDSLESGFAHPILVADERSPAPYFGDLHWHTNRSDGSRTPDEGYHYARDVVGLDFTARTDHDVHHLWPCLDEQSWDEAKRDARRWDDPGQFAALLGHEWTGGIGHMSVYYRDFAQPVYGADRFSTPDALWAAMAGVEALTVPHHPSSLRQPSFSWDHHDERLLRVVEIYSNKGNAEFPEATWAPLPYDAPAARVQMGDRGTVQVAWSKGRRYSVIGSTDNHFGAPGTPVLQRAARRAGWAGSGLAVVWAPRLSREAVYDAMKAGQTYATTGPRIRVEWSRGEGRRLQGRVVGTAPLEAVEIVGVFEGGPPSFPTLREIEPRHERIADIDWVVPADVTASGAYVRVFQSDGEMAWSSPVFWEE